MVTTKLKVTTQGDELLLIIKKSLNLTLVGFKPNYLF